VRRPSYPLASWPDGRVAEPSLRSHRTLQPACWATLRLVLVLHDWLPAELRAMRQGAETAKREEAQTTAVLKSVEQQAAEQYARDQAAAEQELAVMHGTWEPDEGTGYLYNKAQRWYYDKATSMYYGGEPPTWTADPAMPAAAKFGAEPAPAAGVKTASGEPFLFSRNVRLFVVASLCFMGRLISSCWLSPPTQE